MSRIIHSRPCFNQIGRQVAPAFGNNRIAHEGPMRHYPRAELRVSASRDKFEAMKVAAWLTRVLLIVAIIGLVARPFAVMANGSAMAAASMSEMPAGMPCCPHDQPEVPDCQKACLSMVSCAAMCISAVPMFSGLAFAFRLGDAIQPTSDRMGETIAVEPPARPPRI